MSAHPALAQAIQSLRASDRATAYTLLRELTTAEPQLPDGWLWLAAASEDVAEKRAALQRVLQLNPAEQRAFAALRALGADAAPPPAAVAAAPASQRPATIPSIRFAPSGPIRRAIPWNLVALVAAVLVLVPMLLLLV